VIALIGVNLRVDRYILACAHRLSAPAAAALERRPVANGLSLGVIILLACFRPTHWGLYGPATTGESGNDFGETVVTGMGTA